MQKLSAFSHQKIDVGSSVCCLQAFCHDYVQMEKEEGSFVRAEMSAHSELSPLCLKL